MSMTPCVAFLTIAGRGPNLAQASPMYRATRRYSMMSQHGPQQIRAHRTCSVLQHLPTVTWEEPITDSFALWYAEPSLTSPQLLKFHHGARTQFRLFCTDSSPTTCGALSMLARE